MVAVYYLLFFFSGAAALAYEVVWTRYLGLVFGGSHLAITTVLAVFMGGLALGSHALGERADRTARPLRLYGLLEIGIGVSAAAFLGLMKIYPLVYVPLARGADDRVVYLTTVRVIFAVVAMIVPTTLMGGTLPVMTRFVARRSEGLAHHLPFLYGLNTFGSVAGAVVTGFLLLRVLGAGRTVWLAIATNMIIGAVAVFLREPRPVEERAAPEVAGADSSTNRDQYRLGALSVGLVLAGIGISGFCALGYEVLWTRILSVVIGTSTYGFTIMLVAFLTGIAVGSQVWGILSRLRPGRTPSGASATVLGFGAVQITIGLSALVVSFFLRDLPAHAIRLQNVLLNTRISEFEVRQGANFLVAFTYMFVPACFMGLAFPLAGTIYASHRRRVGGAIGTVLAYNTAGAILGAAVSGFALIYLFGIERSLQLLSVLNVGIGLCVAASLVSRRWLFCGAAVLSGTFFILLAARPDWGRMWDSRYFAIYRNNQRGAFATPEKVREALENTEVLYYKEGINETISVIRPKGGTQGVIVNGRVEATSSRQDMQCQRTLGHLPMLLHKNPASVFVLGLGTGMTLGATSIHPGVRRITLAELERGVIPAARTFAAYNHHVLDNPKLRIVFNDGRNFLTTTSEKFDVITADPIHPWSGGASYLYTTEYFRTVAERLNPGGVACQWLPIYELSVGDLRSVVATFTKNFRYTMLWLTHYDAELVGSNSPIELDENNLARRIADPAIRRDLDSVDMSSVEGFLSYFVAGASGLAAFSGDAVVNTDDNLYLEFSSAASVGLGGLMGRNVVALTAHRESLLPRLRPARPETAAAAQSARWKRNLEAARVYDRLHAMFLWNRTDTPEFAAEMAAFRASFPDYAPGRFLETEALDELARTPRLVGSEPLALQDAKGGRADVEISAVVMKVGDARGAVAFVDNAARRVYGERYFDGPWSQIEPSLERFAREVLTDVREEYRARSEAARAAGRTLPLAEPTLSGVGETILARTRAAQGKPE